MWPPSLIRGIFQYPRREVLQTFRSTSKSQHNNESPSPHTGITERFGRTSSFTNASKQAVRLLCISAPAGQEEFFAQVGVSVATRTTLPPKLDKAGQAKFMKKTQDLAANTAPNC